MAEEQIEQEVTSEGQESFSFVVKAGEEQAISFEGKENLLCAISLCEVNGEKPTKETKVYAKYLNLLEDDKQEEKTIEIASFTPENCEAQDIQFNCAAENKTVIKVEGDCAIEISGIYYDGGSEEEEEEEEEQKEE